MTPWPDPGTPRANHFEPPVGEPPRFPKTCEGRKSRSSHVPGTHDPCSSAAPRDSWRAQGGSMRYTKRSIARAVAVVAAVVVAGSGVARAEVAATGMFGINVHISAPFTSGTFDGEITSFNAGSFSVGGTAVDLNG